MIKKLLNEFMNRGEVDAILLGGSRATGAYDEKSDYDFYVYLNSPFKEIHRRDILDKYCSYMEYSNEFWELEDDGILNNGIEIEMIYRDIDTFEKTLENTKNGNVNMGYSTCFISNLVHSEIIFDKTGRFKKMVETYNNSLTKELIQEIIDVNYPIIYDKMPAMFKQIKKAIERNDLHSINHRITAYFEMYYDILFAINNELHPGEKRLLTLASKLKDLPVGFVEDVNIVFSNIFNNNDVVLCSLKRLSMSLKDLLQEKEYIR